MNRPHEGDPAVSAWLNAVERRLKPLDSRPRANIVEGFRAHIEDSIAGGLLVETALSRMGTPNECARRVLEEHAEATGQDERTYLVNGKRVLQIIASALSLAAGLAVLFLPGYVVATADSSGNQEIETVTTLEWTGPWAIALVLIPFVIASLPLLLKGRAWQVVSVVSAVLLVVFGLLSSWSIGFYYLPAAAISLIAVFLPTRRPAT